MLSDSYPLGATASLQRLSPALATRFEAAFAATEADLRQWMPATAKEQEDALSFLEGCTRAFEEARTFAYAIMAPEGDVAGYVNLTPEHRHALVAYWVHPRWRGRGLAARSVGVLVDAAFAAWASLERIHAHLDAANGASRRVLEEAGFSHHETFVRPPRTRSETETEWLFVRERGPRDPRGAAIPELDDRAEGHG